MLNRLALWSSILAVVLSMAPLALAARFAKKREDVQLARTSAVAHRELPREWTWTKQAVTFDHMFRTPRN